MFGTPYRYNSLPKLSSSSAIFAGLCYGRTPKEKFDIGNACDPRVTFSDSKTYLIDGREETFHTSMPFAVAAARHGDLNLFLGVVASPHFFWTIPYSERNDRQEHVGKTLAEACACEAFARGHLEMFDGIVAAAKLASAKDLQHKHDRDRHSLSAATHFLEMNMTSVEYIFDWLSLGSERDTGKLAEAFERIATLVSSEFGQKGLPNLRQRLSQLWLDAGLARALPAHQDPLVLEMPLQFAQALGASKSSARGLRVDQGPPPELGGIGKALCLFIKSELAIGCRHAFDSGEGFAPESIAGIFDGDLEKVAGGGPCENGACEPAIRDHRSKRGKVAFGFLLRA